MTLIVLPSYIALGFEGGPTFSTSVVKLSAGREARNASRTTAIWHYSWDYENRTAAQNAGLQALFLTHAGMLRRFLMYDFTDHALENGIIGVGDGATVDFTLVKIYDSGNGHPYTRTLRHIDESSLVVKVNGSPVSASFVQDADGTITLPSSTPPGMGQSITASCTFYVPVRFDTDVFASVADGPQGRFLSARGLTATEVIPE